MARVAVGALIFGVMDRAAGVLLRANGVLPSPRDGARVVQSARLLLAQPFAQPGWSTPDRGRADRFTVGVLGGSVAFDFAYYLLERGDARQRAFGALSGGRAVAVLNLAIPGGAQPLQMHMLGIARHRVDAAVVLDGFNEVFLSGHACGPAARFWRERADRATADLLAPSFDRLRRFSLWADRTELRPLMGGTVFELLRRRENIAASQDLLADLRTAHGAVETPGPYVTIDASAEMLASLWSECVRGTHALARSARVPIWFFLQPNQYAGGRAAFTPEEQRCCVRPNRAREALRPRYDALERAATSLRAEGIAAHSLRGALHDEPGTVYRDDCCHVNDRGIARLGEAMGATLRANAR